MMQSLDTLLRISENQKSQLIKGKVQYVEDLILNSPQEIAGKCRISQIDAKRIIDAVCSEVAPPKVRLLEDVRHEGDEKCTTGDPHLDSALNGGMRTGMVWEIAGESAAGKTQFALQLSLFAQLPKDKGGLYGSTCYLTTSSTLPTSRLLQISQEHPILSESNCSLEAVHTLSTPTLPTLIRALSQTLPHFIQRSRDRNNKPVKVLIVDALAELFHTSNKTTTATLVERSKNVSEVSILLHALASTHQIAVLVLNEVVDVFERCGGSNIGEGELVYSDQSRWFSRANSVPGEDRKEASLGLVWANQVNVRILLSRTGRRRYLDDVEKNISKRHRSGINPQNPSTNSIESEDQLTLIRRLSVVFSSISCPISMDYIVTGAGISVLPGGEVHPYSRGEPHMQSHFAQEARTPSHQVPQIDPRSQISPLDVGIAEGGGHAEEDPLGNPGDVGTDNGGDEWDKYWGADDIPPDVYQSVDLGGLDAQEHL
ncbi:P-loop containing nucleoside triphosphate hydrolase protein [Collybia nuda]|uniref:P-loop containing nucleoside triphosphate hydrolase protein n=1 Tax=Collybia nuda TaxID=64659 RepID=A0A9P5YEL5_9AGAR|nr:P-loop containing nucleoside triphosphate hydrolase protein [Collybia nuda]